MSELSWKTVPVELLQKIFASLDEPTDLVQAIMVCKNWRRTSYPRLYASISLKSYHQASKLATALWQSKYKPGDLVKELNFGDLCSHTYHEETLLKLIDLCPHLTCLNVNPRKITDTLYPRLLEYHEKGQLQHIRSLPSFWNQEADSLQDLYNCAALAMKASLTHLQIVEPTTYLGRRSDPRQPSKKCLEVGHTNLLEHLTSFPRLQTIDVDYTAATFLHSQDRLIDNCANQTSKIHFKLTNVDLLQRGSQFPQVPQLDLEKIKQQPHNKELLISGYVMTTQDLEYIMHKFTGLAKVIVSGGLLNDARAIDWLADNNMLSKEVFPRFIQFLTSTGDFEVGTLTTTPEVDELLEAIAKHRKVNILNFSYSSDVYAESLYFSLTNTKKELLHSFRPEFGVRKDGAWEMTLRPLHEEYMAIYKQTLRHFAGDSVEQIYLEQVVREPFEEDDDIGDALSYILDHYTAIKRISLEGVRLESYNGHATRRLDDLLLTNATFYPGVLSNLSNSLEYVDQMTLEGDSLKTVGAEDAHISIEMPNTTFGEITALLDPYEDHDQDLQLITIHTSATDTIHYLLSFKELNIFITKDVLENASANFDTDAILFFCIKCVDVKTFNNGRICFNLHTKESYSL